MRNRLLIAAFVAVFAVAGYAEIAPNIDWYTSNTSANEFTITTAGQLVGLANLVNGSTTDFDGKTVILGADITLNDITEADLVSCTGSAYNSWSAIGTGSNKFKGTFDGGGHKISGIFNNSNGIGLFGYIEKGTIKNIGVVASCYKGPSCVGGLVGNNDGTISNSYSTATVMGTTYAGGLVGCNYGTISNSYAAGNVRTQNNTTLGGLVAINSSTSFIVNSYYDKNNVPSSSSSYGIGKTTEEMKNDEFVELLNNWVSTSPTIMNKWISTTDGYPELDPDDTGSIKYFLPPGEGTPDEPYIISTPEELENFSYCVSIGKSFSGEYIKLGNDIELENDWTAIGTEENPFSGTFNGDGYIISGVRIYSKNDYQGLFGYVDNGTIENLGVNVNISCNKYNYIGGLVGYNDGGTISNSYAISQITGGSSHCSYVGGLVGRNDGGTISNSYAISQITEYVREVDGLVGYNYLYGDNIGTITNSYYDKTIYTYTLSSEDYGSKDYGKTTEEMKTQDTYDNWDFTDIWGINESINDGYPYLRVPIKDINLIISDEAAYYENTIPLNGTIQPEKARQNITWSIENGNANIAEDNKSITFNAAEEIIVKATVENGLGIGKDYEKVFSINVNQAEFKNPAIPSNLTATYGQTLADVILTQTPNGIWSWKDNTTLVGDVGEQYHYAIFTPTDNNYYTAEYSLKITVNPIIYQYCVLNKGKACLKGSYVVCPAGSQPSQVCSYDNIITPISSTQVASSNIQIQTTPTAILLSNLPPNAKIEAYNLQGKQIHSSNSENSQILKILVQTKGMYIVKVNDSILRVLVM